MQDAIEAGTILIQKDTLMPDSLLPQGEPYSSGWVSVGRLDRPGLEMSIHKAGRTFFYLAGEVKATVFGFDEQEAVRKAVKRLIKNVKTQASIASGDFDRASGPRAACAPRHVYRSPSVRCKEPNPVRGMSNPDVI